MKFKSNSIIKKSLIQFIINKTKMKQPFGAWMIGGILILKNWVQSIRNLNKYYAIILIYPFYFLLRYKTKINMGYILRVTEST